MARDTARACPTSLPDGWRRVAVPRTASNHPTKAFEHSSGVRGSYPDG
ncbi:hypothetical protein BN2475_110019 [Paraburkholderia ribeironis]|uniref:Uncharacterized protein n=1 Tax=Paraburkholderia ribeironis TaxID=1247936 RepID=A0A1N7RQC9_9BURK|nr:hypothetical protein BN2475_110019 [Paraburkholderia ribeironis]